MTSQTDATTVFDVGDSDAETLSQPTSAMSRAEVNESVNSAATIGIIICFVIPIVIIEFGNVMTIASFVTYRRLRRSKYIPVVITPVVITYLSSAWP